MEIKALRIDFGKINEGTWFILDPMGASALIEVDDIAFLRMLACPHKSSYELKITSYEIANDLLEIPFDASVEQRVEAFLKVWHSVEDLQ